MQAGRTHGSTARRWLGVALTLTVAVSLVSLPATAFAAYAYNGGPTQATTSVFVPNDSTPFAVQISAPAGSGLPAGTTEYVKPRFSPQNKPASTLNRGSVWNRVTHQWVSEQDSEWSDFPTITINPDGSLPTGPESWLYMRFGDDTQDNASSGAAGGWFLFISISIGVQGNTYNNTADLPEGELMSLATTHTISWVHNGPSSGLGANVPVAATAVGSTSTVDECVRTEPNTIDDDFDGIIDNEGSQGDRTGDFRMAVPAGTHFDVRTGDSNQTVVNGWSNQLSGPTDTDVALGASDMTPPSAPTGLHATPGYKVRLTWNAASDNVGVSAYNVYRWSDTETVDVGNPSLTSATPPHVRIGTTSNTSFVDTSAAQTGWTYHYEVRAVDAATNVGPRSGTADCVAGPADVTPPSTTVSGLPTSGVQAGPVTFSLSATDTQSGVARTFYTVDGSAATTYTAPVLVTGIGPHNVTDWSVDLSGNVESAHSANFTISAGPPLTTISGIPGGWSTVPVTFSLTATGDASPFTTYYALGAAPALTYLVPVTVSSEGTTVVSYRSTNSIAQSETSKTATIRIDATPPATTISGLPASGTPAPGSATFTLSSTDNASGVAHIQYLLDSSVTTQTYGAPVMVSGNGSHSVTYWAVDNAGNVESPHVATFEIAGKAATAITITRSASGVTLPKPFILQGVLTPGVLNDPCVVYVKKPGSARWSYSSNRLAFSVTGSGANWWYRYTPKLRGTYTYYVAFAGDATRNASQSGTVKVTVK